MREFLCDVGVGEMVDLVVWFGEEMDCYEVGFFVYVELVGGVIGYGDQVVFYVFDFIDFVIYVQGEQVGVGDEEVYFVFFVEVFVEEFFLKFGVVWVVWGD